MDKYTVGQTLNHPTLGDVRVVQFINNINFEVSPGVTADIGVDIKEACHVAEAEDGHGFRAYHRADGLYFVPA